MSTTLPPPDTRTARQRWRDFWFAPQDPITLGFIRIVTGLLVLYIHLAYSLDLQAFFGKRAWWGNEYIERERREYPWQVGSFWDWDDYTPQARLPEYPHRHAAVLEFIKTVADKPPLERERALRFLNRVADNDNGANSLVSLEYLRNLRTLDSTWDASLYYLVEEKWPPAKPNEPEPLRIYPPQQWTGVSWAKEGKDGRAAVAEEIRDFRDILPKDPDSREYVLNHLMELDPPHRKAFASFLNTLPQDKAERDRLIDYLDYWNADPRVSYRTGQSIFSVWFHVTDPTEMALIHAAVLFIIVLFTLGFCTRVTSVLTWLATVGYIHRTNQVLFGQDTMMNILLIYLTIGNSGAALSVDRLIARYRAVRASLRRSGTIDPATKAFLSTPPLSSGAGFGIRLIQVHFCFIYLAAGLSKLKGGPWWNGTAFWDVMVNPEFTLLRYTWFEKMIREVAKIKPLYYTITTFGVWFTWGLEISLPFLVWTRLRPVVIWLAVLLHASIGVLMGLNLFELLMMTILLVFIPAGAIRDRLRGGPGLPKLGFAFNPTEAKCARAAAVVAAADVDSQVTVEPKPGARQPAVTPAGGSSLSGPDGVSALFGNLRLLRPLRVLLVVPGMKALLARLLFPAPPPPTTGTGAKPGPKTPAAAR
ncbi:MAG TPA: hypothetical protein VKE74_25255 [Gemmataceae bacterium]|nr:hypothetical protein [Gemmataceae bacterium]